MSENKRERVYNGNFLFNRTKNRKHFYTAYNLESVRRIFNEPEGTTIKLLTEPNKHTNLPSVWEAGGSHGADSNMYALLDEYMHTPKPNIVNRNNRSLELRHAQQTIWGSSYLITGNYRKRNYESRPGHREVIISLYTLSGFGEENVPNKRGEETLRGFAYFDLNDRQVFNTRADFEKVTIDLTDPAAYYTHGAVELKTLPNIAKEKLLTFMSFEPLLSKRWMPISQYNSEKYGEFPEPTQMTEYPTVKEMYAAMSEYCWRANIDQRQADPQFINVEFLLTEDGTVNIIGLHNLGAAFQTSIDFHELKLFWFPDQDPWNEDGLMELRQNLIKNTKAAPKEPEFEKNGEEVEYVTLHAFSKVYKYIG